MRSPLGERDTKHPQGETQHEKGAVWTDGLRLSAGIQGNPGAVRWEQAGQHSPWLRLETLLRVGVIWEQWATWPRSAVSSESKHMCGHVCRASDWWENPTAEGSGADCVKPISLSPHSEKQTPTDHSDTLFFSCQHLEPGLTLLEWIKTGVFLAFLHV